MSRRTRSAARRRRPPAIRSSGRRSSRYRWSSSRAILDHRVAAGRAADLLGDLVRHRRCLNERFIAQPSRGVDAALTCLEHLGLHVPASVQALKNPPCSPASAGSSRRLRTRAGPRKPNRGQTESLATRRRDCSTPSGGEEPLDSRRGAQNRDAVAVGDQLEVVVDGGLQRGRRKSGPKALRRDPRGGLAGTRWSHATRAWKRTRRRPSRLAG